MKLYTREPHSYQNSRRRRSRSPHFLSAVEVEHERVEAHRSYAETIFGWSMHGSSEVNSTSRPGSSSSRLRLRL